MLGKLRRFIQKVMRKEEGQGMVEYGVILALVLVAVVFFAGTIGASQKSAGSTVGTQITNSVTNPTLP